MGGDQQDIFVVGIDPAPGKKSTIFDGTKAAPVDLEIDKLQKRLDEERNKPDGVLICWDAPLTGPSNRGVGAYHPGDLTTRLVDRLFTAKADKERGKKPFLATPKGITVMGYGSCFHWSISRALLGLPRMGKYEPPVKDLPFKPCYSEEDRPAGTGKYVVEVHPALALWCWLRNEKDVPHGWSYKRDIISKNKVKHSKDDVRGWLWTKLKEKLPGDLHPWAAGWEPANDDQLDAVVAWLLGKLWLSGQGEVRLVGSLALGTFLLPDPGEAIQAALDEFSGKHKTGA